ncbi:MAG: helix-turn-helix domain-containing protein [Ferruginibacter sp.]
METVNSNKPLNFKEACAYLGYSKGSMYKLTSSQIIPFSKPNGGKLFFDKNDLDDWLLKSKTKSLRERQIDAATYVTTNKVA